MYKLYHESKTISKNVVLSELIPVFFYLYLENPSSQMAYVNQCVPANLNPQLVYWNPTILSNNQLQLQLQQVQLRQNAHTQRQMQSRKNEKTRQIQSQKVKKIISQSWLPFDLNLSSINRSVPDSLICVGYRLRPIGAFGL